MKRIAVLTSGGDAPGMNACIRAVVKAGQYHNAQVFGVRDGFEGLIHGSFQHLKYEHVNNIIQQGGTFLGTARSEAFRTNEGRIQAAKHIKEFNIEALIVIGGDGSFRGAQAFAEEFGIAVVGIPATIDNDIENTEYTLGFATALNTVVEAVDKIRDTASSHKRIFFVEVMGRDAGALALDAALASGAEDVLIPEEITDIPQLAADIKANNKGQRSSIVIVSEGDDAGGAIAVLKKIKPLLPDYDLKHTILGHIQRGGRPTPKDRITATMWGDKAVELIMQGQTDVMVGLKQGNVVVEKIGTKAHSLLKIPQKLALLHRMQTKFNC